MVAFVVLTLVVPELLVFGTTTTFNLQRTRLIKIQSAGNIPLFVQGGGLVSDTDAHPNIVNSLGP